MLPAGQCNAIRKTVYDRDVACWSVQCHSQNSLRQRCCLLVSAMPFAKQSTTEMLPAGQCNAIRKTVYDRDVACWSVQCHSQNSLRQRCCLLVSAMPFAKQSTTEMLPAGQCNAIRKTVYDRDVACWSVQCHSQNSLRQRCCLLVSAMPFAKQSSTEMLPAGQCNAIRKTVYDRDVACWSVQCHSQNSLRQRCCLLVSAMPFAKQSSTEMLPAGQCNAIRKTVFDRDVACWSVQCHSQNSLRQRCCLLVSAMPFTKQSSTEMLPAGQCNAIHKTVFDRDVACWSVQCHSQNSLRQRCCLLVSAMPFTKQSSTEMLPAGQCNAIHKTVYDRDVACWSVQCHSQNSLRQRRCLLVSALPFTKQSTTETLPAGQCTAIHKTVYDRDVACWSVHCHSQNSLRQRRCLLVSALPFTKQSTTETLPAGQCTAIYKTVYDRDVACWSVHCHLQNSLRQRRCLLVSALPFTKQSTTETLPAGQCTAIYKTVYDRDVACWSVHCHLQNSLRQRCCLLETFAMRALLLNWLSLRCCWLSCCLIAECNLCGLLWNFPGCVCV